MSQRQPGVDSLQEGRGCLDRVGTARRANLNHGQNQSDETTGSIQQGDEGLVNSQEGDRGQNGEAGQAPEVHLFNAHPVVDHGRHHRALNNTHEEHRNQGTAQGPQAGVATAGELAGDRRVHHEVGDSANPQAQGHEVGGQAVAVGGHLVQAGLLNGDGVAGDRAEFTGLVGGVAGNLPHGVPQGGR